jgi:hypothetical protein
MSSLSLEADKLFPEENFDDIVPQSPPNFRMSSMFRFVSGRPRSPSPQRKPKVILRALLVAEDSDWPEDAQLQISEAMAGRESEVTESLKEPGYKAFWGAAYKRVKEEDMQKPFNEIVLSPFLTTVRAGKLVPGLECSAICGPILANHVEDLLPREMLTEPMETFLVDDAMLGAPTEFTVMIKIVPQQDSETDTKTDTTEPRLSEDSFIGTAKNGFKFVGPLNMKERSQAATALQTQWRGKHAKKQVTDLKQHRAAASVQARVRANKSKSKVNLLKAENALPEDEKKARAKAAAGIQAGMRAKKAKSKIGFLKGHKKLPEDEQKAREQAAVKLQASRRAHAAKAEAEKRAKQKKAKSKATNAAPMVTSTPASSPPSSKRKGVMATLRGAASTRPGSSSHRDRKRDRDSQEQVAVGAGAIARDAADPSAALLSA